MLGNIWNNYMLTLQHKIAVGPRKENETKLTDQLTEKTETN